MFNIKKIGYKIIALVFVFQILSCKDVNKDLEIVKNMVEGNFEATINKDYDFFIRTSHPKILKKDSKEDFKKFMKFALEGNEEVTIEMFYKGKMPKYNVSEVFEDKANNLKYAFASYDLDIKMIFHKQSFDTKEMKEQVLEVYRNQGIKAVFVSDNTLTTLMKNRILVIMKSNETNNKWIGVNYESGQTSSEILSYGLLDITEKYLQNLNDKSN